MLCCQCKKNQATKVYDRITDGRRQTEYYCLDCYDRLFISMPEISSARGGEQIAVCPCCGLTEEEFKARGVVGCAQCYEFLKTAVLPAVIRTQGINAHCGKKPKTSDEREEKIKRRNQLKELIEKSMKAKKFEEAKTYSEELNRLNKILYREGSDV